ncbi:putative reverse transcriptase domain-containing protein [Tanacetum coccineum]
MESVFSLAICPAVVKVKSRLVLCKSMLLPWWNSMLRPPLQSSSMPCHGPSTKGKMMTDKLMPEGEIKKIENEMLILKVVPEESKTMQEVIEFTTELMEDKTHAYAERQAERKRKAPAKVYALKCGGQNPDNGRAVLLYIVPIPLDHGYNVELADGRIIGVNTILMGCTLNFLNHPFNINLMPVEMGSFDVIIGMDWLSKYSAIIDCAKKIVRNTSRELKSYRSLLW